MLVYRYDGRFPEKQRVATDLLRQGIAAGSLRLPHQAIMEFVAAATRPIRGRAILTQAEALREAEELLKQFEVLFPNEAIVREAVRGCASYQLNWFDVHLWAYAECNGIPENWSEDFQHDRLYGSVRAVNPFAVA